MKPYAAHNVDTRTAVIATVAVFGATLLWLETTAIRKQSTASMRLSNGGSVLTCTAQARDMQNPRPALFIGCGVSD